GERSHRCARSDRRDDRRPDQPPHDDLNEGAVPLERHQPVIGGAATLPITRPGVFHKAPAAL
ncbi:hypothetical protein, partial [Escherichia coli]|uniref:hypothetical protein n=1 Tax=Escherichia coli TaxID=562 RepID=UPI001954BD0D